MNKITYEHPQLQPTLKDGEDSLIYRVHPNYGVLVVQSTEGELSAIEIFYTAKEDDDDVYFFEEHGVYRTEYPNEITAFIDKITEKRLEPYLLQDMTNDLI